MTGHQMTPVQTSTVEGVRTIIFMCMDCDLHGFFSAPPDVADGAMADLMATHWAATGGEPT